jgi:hypothetical protein
MKGAVSVLTVRELIRQLLDEPMDATVYISKGVGPLGRVHHEVTDKIYVVLEPVRKP